MDDSARKPLSGSVRSNPKQAWKRRSQTQTATAQSSPQSNFHHSYNFPNYMQNTESSRAKARADPLERQSRRGGSGAAKRRGNNINNNSEFHQKGASACQSQPREIRKELPRDIIEEILIRLPVKSIIKSKLVCKHWRSLISDPSFARAHLKFVNRNPKSPDLIDSFDEMLLVCDEKGLNKRVLWIPPSVQYDVDSIFIGSCDGLICMIGNEKMTVFNPATRKYVSVPNPSVQKWYKGINQSFWNDPYSEWGFGFNPYANEYKIVYIYCERKPNHRGWCRAEVLTLGKDLSWRKIEGCSAAVPQYEALYIGAALYWNVYDSVLLFDLSEEKFELIETPKEKCENYDCEIMDLNGRLCWVSAWVGWDGMVNLWALNEPVKNKSSWTLLRTIKPSFLIRDPDNILFLCYIPRNKIIVSVSDLEDGLSYCLDFIVKNDSIEVVISGPVKFWASDFGAYVESLIPLPKV